MELKRKLSVLYIHHNPHFGGASRSLLESIKAFPKNTVSPYLITPKGSTSLYFKDQKVPTINVLGTSIFDNTEYGYYRGLRWLILIREIIYIPSSLFALLKAKREFPNIDLVHVNESLALISIIFAKWIFNKPIIVHIRSVQRENTSSLRSKLVNYTLKKYSNALIAIDETVARSMPPDLCVSIIHNGFNHKLDKVDKRLVHSAINSKKLIIGIVGNYLYVKGVMEFLKSAKECINAGMDIEFWMIGDRGKIENKSVLKYFKYSQEAREEVVRFIRSNNMMKEVKLIPFTSNITQYYEKMDVVCFPSHFNAPGRPIFEAAIFGIPSIVSVDNPTSDTVVDGETGICIQPKNVIELTEAMKFYYNNPVKRMEMGDNARKLAKKYFDIEKNSIALLKVYESLVS